MATYVTLYQFTDQGIRNVKDSPNRLKAGIEQARAAGINVVGAYYLQGPYDLVVISEASDEDAATAFALSIGKQGNVRTTTMRAWDADQFAQILEKVR
jgi:uncharacterized protein with GYD domain